MTQSPHVQKSKSSQDDLLVNNNNKRALYRDGPIRPAPLPPVTSKKIKPVRKAPPPPVTKTHHSPEPPPIPSSPRPSFSRTLPPSTNNNNKPPPPIRGSSLKSSSSQMQENCNEELYEPLQSCQEVNIIDDTIPPPLPARKSNSTLIPKPPSLITLPSLKPPAPPPTRPPSSRPPPSLPPLPPLPPKFLPNDEDTYEGDDYCDVDTAVKMKTEYQGTTTFTNATLTHANHVEIKTVWSPPIDKQERQDVDDSVESGDEVYTEMSPQQLPEDEYTIMSPTPLQLGKPSKLNKSQQPPPHIAVSLPELPPKPLKKVSHKTTPPTAPKQPKIPKKGPKLLPKNKRSAPHLPPPLPPMDINTSSSSSNIDEEQELYEPIESSSNNQKSSFVQEELYY